MDDKTKPFFFSDLTVDTSRLPSDSVPPVSPMPAPAAPGAPVTPSGEAAQPIFFSGLQLDISRLQPGTPGLPATDTVMLNESGELVPAPTTPLPEDASELGGGDDAPSDGASRASIVLIGDYSGGMDGVAGSCAEKEVVVKAIMPGGGAGAGLGISYRILEGGGRLVKSDGFVTGAEGIARFKYVFGEVVGVNVIELSLSTNPEAPAPQLRFTTVEAKLKRVGSGSLAAPIGSALRRLIKVKLTGPREKAIVGEEVVPTVSTPGHWGYFIPEKGLTDVNGEAAFAFVVDLGATPRSFDMKFAAPRFTSAAKKAVMTKETISAKVEVRTKAPIIDIVTAGAALTGQGQIGVPGEKLEKAFRVLPAPMHFSLVTGDGKFDTAGLPAIPDGHGGIRVLPPTEVRFIPVGIGPWLIGCEPDVAGAPPMEVFAVGAPEVRLVSADNPANELTPVIAVNPLAPEMKHIFQIEVRVPTHLSHPEKLTASYAVLDECGRARPYLEQAAEPPPLHPAGVDISHRFYVLRSGKLAAVTSKPDSWVIGPTPATRIQFVQVPSGNILRASVALPDSFIQDSPPKKREPQPGLRIFATDEAIAKKTRERLEEYAGTALHLEKVKDREHDDIFERPLTEWRVLIKKDVVKEKNAEQAAFFPSLEEAINCPDKVRIFPVFGDPKKGFFGAQFKSAIIDFDDLRDLDKLGSASIPWRMTARQYLAHELKERSVLASEEKWWTLTKEQRAQHQLDIDKGNLEADGGKIWVRIHYQAGFGAENAYRKRLDPKISFKVLEAHPIDAAPGLKELVIKGFGFAQALQIRDYAVIRYRDPDSRELRAEFWDIAQVNTTVIKLGGVWYAKIEVNAKGEVTKVIPID